MYSERAPFKLPSTQSLSSNLINLFNPAPCLINLFNPTPFIQPQQSLSPNHATMDKQSQDAKSEPRKEINVETINFHQVIEHFDDDGKLKNKEQTRLLIPCSICGLDLPLFDTIEGQSSFSTDDYHIRYTVLSCGHGFGSECIMEWLEVKFRCPLCRSNPFPSITSDDVLEVYGDIADQSEDIRNIKKFLREQKAQREGSTPRAS